MATTAARDTSPGQGRDPVNQARDVRVFDHGRVHIGNNYGTTAQSESRQRQNRVLRNLSSVPYEDRKNVNPPRLAGTCKWFLAHPLYQQWRKGTNAMLWVSAEPGCGKSVLSRFLIDEELSTKYDTQAPSDGIICYFFFKDGIQDQRTLQDALRCILKQLFTQKRILLSHSVLDRFETENHLSASALWRLLFQAIDKPDVGHIVILLDAVDECEQESRHELFELLAAGPGTRLDKQSPQFRLFLTSRPSTNLRNGLGNLAVIHLEGETAEEVDKIAEEIKLVIETNIELICRRFSIPSDQRKGLRSRLRSVENRTYLWAHLTLDLIRKDLLAGRRDVLAYSQELPQSVEAAYNSMLIQSHSPSLAERLLQIVLAATRPISLAETAAVLVWSDGAQRDEVGDTLTEQEYERRVRGLCGLFTIVGGKVSLLHQTVREFLLESTQKSRAGQHYQPLVWRHSISMRQSHHFLAQACVRLLLSNETYLPDLSTPGSWGERKLALWSYASLNWNLHARHSGYNDIAAMRELCTGPKDIANPHWFGHYLHHNSGDQQWPADFPFTAIQIAAYCGNLSLIHHLLEVNNLDQVVSSSSGSREGDIVGVNAVSLAAEHGHSQIVEEILSHFPARLRGLLRHNPLTFRDFEKRTPVGTAALHGHAETVSVLLQEGADVDVEDQDGSLPLINAFCSGNKAVIDILLKQDKSSSGVDVDKQLGLLLGRAIRNGKRRAVQGILASDRLDLNISTDQKSQGLHSLNVDWTQEQLILGIPYQPSTFLSMAAYTGEIEIARCLLESGANVNHGDHRGMTPLHWAALMNQSDMVLSLIDWGCNVNATNVRGLTSINLSRDLGIVHTLLDHGARLPGLKLWNQTLKDLALLAVKENSLPVKVSSWLKPVLHATSLDEAGVFADLVKVFTLFNCQDNLLYAIGSISDALKTPTCFEGWHLVHFAAAFDDAGAGSLRRLLVMGAHLECHNSAHETPVDVATKFGNMQSVIENLSKPAAGYFTMKGPEWDSSKLSLCKHTLESGSLSLITQLLDSGIGGENVGTTLLDSMRFVPDHAAVGVLKLLLGSGAKPKECRPLLSQFLLSPDAPEAFELLLSHGADPNEDWKIDLSILHRLANPYGQLMHRVELVGLLLNYDADTHVTDGHGQTPLDIARSYNSPATLIRLLDSATLSRHYRREEEASS